MSGLALAAPPAKAFQALWRSLAAALVLGLGWSGMAPAQAAGPVAVVYWQCVASDPSKACPANTAYPLPTSVGPSARTIVPLDISTVTTGGTAVTALNAGHRTAGGFLYNPIGATINLCINEQGTASGTTSAGALTCIQPGQAYTLAPTAGAVSVITSDSSHPFSGEGLQ